MGSPPKGRQLCPGSNAVQFGDWTPSELSQIAGCGSLWQIASVVYVLSNPVPITERFPFEASLGMGGWAIHPFLVTPFEASSRFRIKRIVVRSFDER